MDLIEREGLLDELKSAMDRAAVGEGRLVLVYGEAGAGKTSLVRTFAAAAADARVAWGGCEALFTPRPLGPLHDMSAAFARGRLRLDETPIDASAIHAAFLRELGSTERVTLAVFEDVHWADGATLDLLKHVGRRVARLPALVVLTYRDDELTVDHPLRFVLGDLAREGPLRLPVPRLSERAVVELARRAARDASSLFALTAGNPFFVTEVLAAPDAWLPESVRDAVLGRAARLSPAAREVLEFVSAVPGRTESGLLAGGPGANAEAVRECLATGMLHAEGDALAFRHEIARMAVLDSLAEPAKRAVHARVLAALLREPAGRGRAARLAHHAEQAGNAQALLEHAPAAAVEAAQLGAHRQSAAHFEAVLRGARGLAPRRRAELLEALAYELYLTGRPDLAIVPRLEALELWRACGVPEGEGRQMRWLSRLSWFVARGDDAVRWGDDAVRVLEALPEGLELAWAISNRAQLHMLADQTDEAIRLGTRAITLARSLGAADVLSHALNNVGTAREQRGDDAGRADLLESLAIARAGDLQEHASRAWTNLGSMDVVRRRYSLAVQDLDEGIAYCVERDLDSWTFYMLGHRARAHLELGHIAAAEADARRVLDGPARAAVIRLPALIPLGLLLARRGDWAEARAMLDDAWTHANETREVQRIGPAAAARAEMAWLEGRPCGEPGETERAYRSAGECRSLELRSELAYWLWRSGTRAAGEVECEGPFALQIAGRWREAAAEWESCGARHARARALAEGDVAAKQVALEEFLAIDARAAAARVRAELAAAGVRGLPRGPRPSTRANPAGLTTRHVEILRLIATGRTNAEIGATLCISPKTAEHHVSALLARLEVSSRAEAVAAARRLGVLGEPAV